MEEKNKTLKPSFYLQDDVISISKQLLGKYLFTNIGNSITGGIIVDTEGYGGINDKACHAYNNCHTKRTATMYQSGGVAYIYLCYGMHHLLNVVTNIEGTPHAVLIRAIEPIKGVDIMLIRRNKKKLSFTLTNGPGSLTKALGITKKLDGESLSSKTIWIEGNNNLTIPSSDIIASPRIGVAYAKEDALLPWRYRISGNKWTSPYK